MDLRGGDLKGKRALIWERKIVMSYINSIAIHEVICIILIIEEARNFQIVKDNKKLVALMISTIRTSIQLQDVIHTAVTYRNMVNYF